MGKYFQQVAVGAVVRNAGQGDGGRVWKADVVKTHHFALHKLRFVVTSNVSTASPSLQDDEINMSWNMEYVPYMIQQEYRRQYPNLDEEMAELEKTHEPGDRHFYSAMLETMTEQYHKEFPDEPDSMVEMQAEYDAYMAAHPGLKERLIREEEEAIAATLYSEDQLEEMFSKDEKTV